MKISIRILFLLIIVALFSCEKQGWIVNCSDCTEDEPKDAPLQIKVDNSYYNRLIMVKVYEGNLEDNILLRQLNVLSGNKEVTINVTLNKQYTVTAEYIIEGITYISVDSAFPRVKYDKNQCDNPCYFIYDNHTNLRLKYD